MSSLNFLQNTKLAKLLARAFVVCEGITVPRAFPTYPLDHPLVRSLAYLLTYRESCNALTFYPVMATHRLRQHVQMIILFLAVPPISSCIRAAPYKWNASRKMAKKKTILKEEKIKFYTNFTRTS